jgi:hypothetical protein
MGKAHHGGAFLMLLIPLLIIPLRKKRYLRRGPLSVL